MNKSNSLINAGIKVLKESPGVKLYVLCTFSSSDLMNFSVTMFLLKFLRRNKKGKTKYSSKEQLRGHEHQWHFTKSGLKVLRRITNKIVQLHHV